jgi:NAD(P)-dependent dehydrogenase (short-subunit alcohol dehydrogenase family)
VKGIHALGCSVLIGDITLHKDAQAWLANLPSASRSQIVFQQTDVTKWTQLESLFEIYSQSQNLPSTVPDIVVAGAGIYEASSAGFWDDRDQDGHYKLLDINMIHPLKLTRIAIRRMQQAKKPGVILHESSIVAQKPSAVLPLYAVSKAGLSHFVRSMGPIEALSGIKVVAVAPGYVSLRGFVEVCLSECVQNCQYATVPRQLKGAQPYWQRGLPVASGRGRERYDCLVDG